MPRCSHASISLLCSTFSSAFFLGNHPVTQRRILSTSVVQTEHRLLTAQCFPQGLYTPPDNIGDHLFFFRVTTEHTLCNSVLLHVLQRFFDLAVRLASETRHSHFFLLLVVAALTSTISLHEVVTVYLHEEWHLSRKAAAWLTTAATAALASLASLSLGALGSWKIAGLSLFDSLDFLTANILLPAGGLFTCIFVGWKLDHHILKAQITNDGELKFRIYGLFSFLLRYVCPAVLLLIFLDNLGVF